jgi:uncharacterized protein YqgQ
VRKCIFHLIIFLKRGRNRMDDIENLSIEIVRVAYELYEKRGMAHGHDLEDWLEAERIVLKRHAEEIEREANIIGATKGKRVSGKTEAKTLKTAKKTSKSSSQKRTKKSPPKNKT